MANTILQINSVANYGSTGKITEQIGELIIQNGFRSVIAYGRYSNPSSSELIKIGSNYSLFKHLLYSRIFDNHGLNSIKSTNNLIREVEKIKPNIIHLHNIHGYYINYEILFNFLNKIKVPIIWTLHDCWPITGHCSHFELINCNKWKTLCFKCPLKNQYPKSIYKDNSRNNFLIKQEKFNSISNLTLVPVSNWLNKIYSESFLKNYPKIVLNNGIDLDVFKPHNNLNFIKAKYNIKNKITVLGVASVWSNQKGLLDFIELSKNNRFQVVLVGVNDKIKTKLPQNILTIYRTNNPDELAELYSIADVFVNPTYQDSYPTVNLEAIACGTPVITYDTGGSAETIGEFTGKIVKKGNISELINAIDEITQIQKKEYIQLCRDWALKNFNKNIKFNSYIELYKSLL